MLTNITQEMLDALAEYLHLSTSDKELVRKIMTTAYHEGYLDGYNKKTLNTTRNYEQDNTIRHIS